MNRKSIIIIIMVIIIIIISWSNHFQRLTGLVWLLSQRSPVKGNIWKFCQVCYLLPGVLPAGNRGKHIICDMFA